MPDPWDLSIDLKMIGYNEQAGHSEQDAEIISAATIMMLERPSPPDEKLLLEVAKKHNDERHRQVTNILLGINNQNRPIDKIVVLSAAIHISCEWAWWYRRRPKTSVSGKPEQRKINNTIRKTSSARELQRLLRICADGSWSVYAKAVIDLSPHTFDELKRAGAKLRIIVDDWRYIFCRSCISAAASQALMDVKIGPPKLYEVDRAADWVKFAYHYVTGKTSSGRGIISGSYESSGKPTGELHSLMMQVGKLYNVQLVTPNSDDRLKPKRRAKSAVIPMFRGQ